MDDVTRLLIKARARIAEPAHWTQGFAAREAWGIPVDPTDDDAFSWCAVGSLRVEAIDEEAGAALRGRAYNRLYVAAGRPPEDLNDEEDHAAVLGMFDRAIRCK